MLFKFFSILNWRQNLKPPSAPCPCFVVNASRKKQKHSMNYLSLSLFLFLSLSLFLFHSFCISAFIFVTHIHFIGRYIACVCVNARYLLVNHFQFLFFTSISVQNLFNTFYQCLYAWPLFLPCHFLSFFLWVFLRIFISTNLCPMHMYLSFLCRCVSFKCSYYLVFLIPLYVSFSIHIIFISCYPRKWFYVSINCMSVYCCDPPLVCEKLFSIIQNESLWEWTKTWRFTVNTKMTFTIVTILGRISKVGLWFVAQCYKTNCGLGKVSQAVYFTYLIKYAAIIFFTPCFTFEHLSIVLWYFTIRIPITSNP